MLDKTNLTHAPLFIARAATAGCHPRATWRREEHREPLPSVLYRIGKYRFFWPAFLSAKIAGYTRGPGPSCMRRQRATFPVSFRRYVLDGPFPGPRSLMGILVWCMRSTSVAHLRSIRTEQQHHTLVRQAASSWTSVTVCAAATCSLVASVLYARLSGCVDDGR